MDRSAAGAALQTTTYAYDGKARITRGDDQGPFGNHAPQVNPAALRGFKCDQRFPGQYRDAETGLFYNYFRDYDPQTGRYVQPDPVGAALTPNLYPYVGSSPLLFRDPFGLAKDSVTANIEAAIAKGDWHSSS